MIFPRHLTLQLILFSVFTAGALAGVGDVTVRTDHPNYPGEGAFQTAEDCVRFATAGITGEQDRAIALFNWILTHQFHLHSPKEPNVPDVSLDDKKHQYDLIVEDANRARFSYGYGLCGTVHSWNDVYWHALGMDSRRRAFPGHTNSEIQYGGSWHTFDTDMAGLVFRPDGVVAGYEDIAKDPAMVKVNPRAVCYPFAWPSDFNGMEKGWQEISKNPDKWYKMYNSGFAAHPGIVSLRRGETFTRFFDRDVFGGPSKRRFWHQQKDGPFRNWTYVNRPSVTQERNNALGNASYCNAVFEYSPDLTDIDHVAEIWGRSENLEAGPQGLGSDNADPAQAVFRHFSPYVICGDPEDNENPWTGKASDGLVVSGDLEGKVQIELSTDEGQTWQPLAPVTGRIQADLTEKVKGRYGWQLRFSIAPGAMLKSLSFSTTCQVSQVIYPRLKAGGTRIHFATSPTGVIDASPNLGLAREALADRLHSVSDNVVYTPRSASQRSAFKTTNNKPGEAVFRVYSPQALTEIHAAARFSIRVPSPPKALWQIEASTDGGKSWKPVAETGSPSDNEYSSGWVYGNTSELDDSNEALVRVRFYNGGYTAQLIDVKIYGLYKEGNAGEVEVVYGWLDGGEEREHGETIPSGESKHVFEVPTGAEIEDRFIRMSVD